MAEKIIILDFGSQYTQLIARRVREANIYCEIQPFHKEVIITEEVKGIILSGSPCSVNDENAPNVNIQALNAHRPVLGICYGAQLTAKNYGGTVGKSNKREYGKATLIVSDHTTLFANIDKESTVWMSHGDSIKALPDNATIIATTNSIPVAAFQINNTPNPLLGIQFHPEVYHSVFGFNILKNFLYNTCHCVGDYSAVSFIDSNIESIKKQIGNQKIIMALSGGVDSTVAAMLIHKAVGHQLTGIFVDNGLLRKNEFEQVLDSYKNIGLNVKGIDAKDIFYEALKGISDPEQKRKIIGKLFIDVFIEEAKKIDGATVLGQGTIYPDVIESVSVHGPAATIKSHHNVGGLPSYLNMELCEPLRFLFKDEVRKVGAALQVPDIILHRHPFPGPGLGIRILGEVSKEKVQLLQEADAIYINALKAQHLYGSIWQAGAILLPVQSVGVMGDERTYEYTLALRAVTSTDGMTADWVHLPYDFLAGISNEIINNVRGINRVVYDISSKPPATIEWE
jgi:GMP synthase (glutamine-hydrolysing)